MTGKLILKFEGSTLGEYPLDKETITIGRRPSNDVVIESLEISGQHSRVITILYDSFLEDMNSTNGTYVNGKLIQKHALQHGDVITVGSKHELQYINEETAISDDVMEKTMVIRPSELSSSQREQAADVSMANAQAMVSSGEEARPASLTLMSGPNTGLSMELKKALTSFGKLGVQVVSISRRPDTYVLSHVYGDNTPVVNGEDIGKQPYTLQENDIIELVGTKVQFKYK